MNSPENSNFRHLVLDIAWYGIALAATSRFLSMYAIRLGAEPWQLSWLVAMPSLVLIISGYFGVQWRNRFSGTDRAVLLPAFSQRFVFLLPALTPFLPERWQPYFLVLAVTLPALPQGIASVVFISLMRESVNQKRINSLFSRRSMAMNVAVAIGAVGFGYWLEETPFPQNYQVMFVIAYIAAMMSLWHVRHVKPLTTGEVKVAEIEVTDNKDQPWRNPQFQRIAVITGITYMAFFSIVPITPLWLVKQFDAAEGFIALFGLLELVSAATAAACTSRLVKRLGDRPVIALGMVGTALSTIIILLAPSLEFTLISAILIGGSWATADIALTGYFANNSPVESTAYSRAYFQLISIGMFIGPLIGGQLAMGSNGLLLVMGIGASLRLLAALVAMVIALDYDRRTASYLLKRIGN